MSSKSKRQVFDLDKLTADAKQTRRTLRNWLKKGETKHEVALQMLVAYCDTMLQMAAELRRTKHRVERLRKQYHDLQRDMGIRR